MPQRTDQIGSEPNWMLSCRGPAGTISGPRLQQGVSDVCLLTVLDIALPKLEPLVAAFVPFVRTGNLIFVSGHIAKKDGQPWTGQLGSEITTEQGKQAARGIAIEPMATL